MMQLEKIAERMRRAVAVFQARPASGLHDDAPGLARWTGGLRMETRHPIGATVFTDMPTELGGTGDQVSPGWMVRSGVAACAATTIAGVAAERGVALGALEVRVSSRSDTRGYLGLAEPDGAPVSPSPKDLEMHVTITAEGVEEAALRDVVRTAQARAPMTALLTNAHAVPVVVNAAKT